MINTLSHKSLQGLLLILLITACSVRIIAPYDPITDQKTSDLQEQIATKLAEWERTTPPVDEAYEFYDQSNAILEILILRNENIPKSQILVSMLKKVKENISLMKNAHEAGELNAEYIKQVKPDIMAQFNAIQKFQMALKRKEES